jgi:hypothetical protein
MTNPSATSDYSWVRAPTASPSAGRLPPELTGNPRVRPTAALHSPTACSGADQCSFHRNCVQLCRSTVPTGRRNNQLVNFARQAASRRPGGIPGPDLCLTTARRRCHRWLRSGIDGFGLFVQPRISDRDACGRRERLDEHLVVVAERLPTRFRRQIQVAENPRRGCVPVQQGTSASAGGSAEANRCGMVGNVFQPNGFGGHRSALTHTRRLATASHIMKGRRSLGHAQRSPPASPRSNTPSDNP